MRSVTCSICGKPLTDSISISFKIGPICRVKKKAQDMNTTNLFSSRAEYDYAIEGNILWIEDLNGMKSVTNDIENVLVDIAKNEDIVNKKIMYKDSEGIWDGIKANITHAENGSVLVNKLEFFPLTETDFNRAKEKLLSK